MPMDPLPIWIQEIANLKPQSGKDGGWADKIADVVDQRVTNKLMITGVTGSVTYTFNKGLFATMLKMAVPSPVAPAAVQVVVNAWQVAASASTIVVAPGSFLGVSTPPTLWSVVAASIVLPPSVAIGAQLLTQALLSATPVPNSMASQLGPGLFQAFSALQVMVTGTNSVPPPAGPQPLILPTAPVI